MGLSPGSYRRILDEAGIQSAHIYKLSLNALKVKILQIRVQIRYIRVLQWKLNDNTGAISRGYKGKTFPYDATLKSGLRLRGLPVQGLDHPLVATLGITRREGRTICTQLIQIR
jgi:hypothetical protein